MVWMGRVTQAFGVLGQVLAWGMIVLAVLATGVLVLRYAFGVGSVALQDAVLYVHAVLVLLGLSVTLMADAHVRVDVFSSQWPARRRALVDLLGTLLLLLPMLLAIMWFGWDYVARSWAIAEGSGDAGGLGGVWLLKGMMLVADALLLLAAAAFAQRAWHGWRGQLPLPSPEPQHEL